MVKDKKKVINGKKDCGKILNREGVNRDEGL